MRERIEFPEPGELEIIDREAPTDSPEDYKPFDASKKDVPPLAAFGSEYKFHVTGLNKAADGFPTTKAELVDAEERRQISKVEKPEARADIESNEEYLTEDAEVVIFAYGSTSRSARYAVNELRKEGIKAGLFRPITLWPFPEKRIAELAKQVKAIAVAEMNRIQSSHPGKPGRPGGSVWRRKAGCALQGNDKTIRNGLARLNQGGRTAGQQRSEPAQG